MKLRHTLLLAALLLAACYVPPNEAELVTNEAVETFVMGTYGAITTVVLATETAKAQTAETPSPAMTMTPEVINLHLQISDGQQPLEALVYLYWPGREEEF